jgi:hypothetical protein
MKCDMRLIILHRSIDKEFEKLGPEKFKEKIIKEVYGEDI